MCCATWVAPTLPGLEPRRAQAALLARILPEAELALAPPVQLVATPQAWVSLRALYASLACMLLGQLQTVHLAVLACILQAVGLHPALSVLLAPTPPL